MEVSVKIESCEDVIIEKNVNRICENEDEIELVSNDNHYIFQKWMIEYIKIIEL